MAGANLDEKHHVVRQVPRRCQVRDTQSGEFLGITYTAFTLDGHEYLSVAWPEYFLEDSDRNRSAISQLRAARRDNASTAYWIGCIANIRSAMNGHKFRAVSEPDGDFTSHAALRLWSADINILGKLAADASAGVIMSKDLA